MPKEIPFTAPTGLTAYVTITNSIGEWYNFNAPPFEGFNAANWTDYALAATEAGASGFYTADMPGIPAGTYNVVARRSTGTPAETDDPLAEGDVGWDGTVARPQAQMQSGIRHGGPETQLYLHDSLGANVPLNITTDLPDAQAVSIRQSQTAGNTGAATVLILGASSGVNISAQDPGFNSYGVKIQGSTNGSGGTAQGPGLVIAGSQGSAGVKIGGGSLGGIGVDISGGFGKTAMRLLGFGNAGSPAIGLDIASAGSVPAVRVTGAGVGAGVSVTGGPTSGSALELLAGAGNAPAVFILGTGAGSGVDSSGGTTGHGARLSGGSGGGSGLTLARGSVAGNDLNLTNFDISTPPATAGRPSSILAMIRRLFEWMSNKKTRDTATGQKKVFGTDGTTVLETQVQSTTGTVDQETQGA